MPPTTMPEPDAPPAAPEPDVLRTPGGRRLYELLADGPATSAELIARSGLSPARVHALVEELTDAGLLVISRHMSRHGGHGGREAPR